MFRIIELGHVIAAPPAAAFGRAAEAMSGLAHLTGFPDGPPIYPGFPAADSTTGLMGALGVMIALLPARRARCVIMFPF